MHKMMGKERKADSAEDDSKESIACEGKHGIPDSGVREDFPQGTQEQIEDRGCQEF
jgi:hypothetical protein